MKPRLVQLAERDARRQSEGRIPVAGIPRSATPRDRGFDSLTACGRDIGSSPVAGVVRGFAAIGLHRPKNNVNVGAVLRAAWCYGAALIVADGTRYRKSRTDTHKAHRKIPLVQTGDVFDAIPYDCVPVAVDLVEGAQSLFDYEHPERAFYIFGPEDGTLGAKTIDRCRDVVYIPTQACMNLAATVNVVLYDRANKRGQKNRNTED